MLEKVASQLLIQVEKKALTWFDYAFLSFQLYLKMFKCFTYQKIKYIKNIVFKVRVIELCLKVFSFWFCTFLSVFICHKHKWVCHYCSSTTCWESFPKAHMTSFIIIDMPCTVNHSTIRDKLMVFSEFIISCYLEFCFYYILRVRD